MNYFNLFCALLSFSIVYLGTPHLIRYLKKLGLEVKDQNKRDKPLIPLSGGLIVVAGVLFGVLVFIFFRTFIIQTKILTTENLIIVFASLLTISIITFVGFLDDLLVHKDKERSGGLNQWQKPFLTLFAAVPLMVINAGHEVMNLPFFGDINFGILYPIFFVPIGVIGAANMINILGGINGVETGMGIIYFGSLGLYAYINESYIAAMFALMIFSALIAFFYYNKFPAKIFPGDSLTYFLGGSLAVIAIVGNLEKAALIVSIPFILEFILKLRSKFKAQCYGEYINEKVKTNYKKYYSVIHFFTNSGKYTEKQIMYFMIGIEIFFSLLIWVI